MSNTTRQAPYPQVVVVSTRKPLYRKYYVGDTYIMRVRPDVEMDTSTVSWGSATAVLKNPEGVDVETQTVPYVDNAGYFIPFTPTSSGYWKLHVTYGRTEDMYAGESRTSRYEMRVVEV